MTISLRTVLTCWVVLFGLLTSSADSQPAEAEPGLHPHIEALEGLWWVEWDDYGEEGVTQRSPVTFGRPWHTTPFQTERGTVYHPVQKLEGPYGRLLWGYWRGMRIGVNEDQSVSVEWPYGIFGSWHGYSRLLPSGGGFQGSWEYNERSGRERWERVYPKVHRARFESSVVSEVEFGSGVAEVRVTYDDFGWSSRNTMRGNRPKFFFKVWGENMWAYSWSDCGGAPGLEIQWNGEFLRQKHLTSIDDHVGYHGTIVIWPDTKPGLKVLRINGEEFPFQLIVEGYPGEKSLELDFVEAATGVVVDSVYPGAEFRVAASYSVSPTPRMLSVLTEVGVSIGEGEAGAFRLEKVSDDPLVFLTEPLTLGDLDGGSAATNESQVFAQMMNVRRSVAVSTEKPRITDISFYTMGPEGARAVDTFVRGVPVFAEVVFDRRMHKSSGKLHLKAGRDELVLEATRADDRGTHFVTPLFLPVTDPPPESAPPDTPSDRKPREPRTEPEATPASDLTLKGRWKVSYVDTVLGQINGVAESDGDYVRVTYVHPDNGYEYQLASTSIEYDERSVAITLEGESPDSGKLDSAGLAELPRLLVAPDAEEVKFKSGEYRAALPTAAGSAAEEVVHLDLTFNEYGDLSGAWHYKADLITERNLWGRGRVGEFQRLDVDPVAGEQRGFEVWILEQPQIIAAFAVEDQYGWEGGVAKYEYPFGSDKSGDTGTQRHIFVIGENLPQKAGDAFELSSGSPEQLTYQLKGYAPESRGRAAWQQMFRQGRDQLLREMSPDQRASAREMDALLLHVRLHPGVVPGSQEFTLNGARATWNLAFGDNFGQIDFVRPGFGDEATPELFVPETTAVTFRTQVEHPLDEFELVIGRNGAVGAVERLSPLIARRSAEDPRLYRTDDFEIVEGEGGRPAAAETPFYRVLPGDEIYVQIADPDLVSVQPAPTVVKVLSGPDHPDSLGTTFEDALRKAADCAGLDLEYFTREKTGRRALEDEGVEADGDAIDWKALAAAESDTITNFIFIRNPLPEALGGDPITKTVRVTVGEHAAMILLKRTFIQMMQQQIAEYQSIGGTTSVRGFGAMIRPHVENERHPFSLVRVTAPDGREVPIAAIWMSEWVQEYFGLSQVEFWNWADAALAEGLQAFVNSLAKTLREAQEVDDCDVEELIRLTGYSFDAVADKLIARLVKEENGRWVPDRFARGCVRSVAGIAAEVRANQDLADIDTALAIAVASIVILPLTMASSALAAGVVLAVDVIDVAYVLGHEIPEYVRRKEEVEFARGASVVTGVGRFDDAKARERSAAQLALIVLGTGVGAGFTAMDAIPKITRALRNTPIEQIRTVGARLTPHIEKGGLKQFRQMNSRQQTEFLAFVGDAREVARTAPGALTPAQRRALLVADRLEEEAGIARAGGGPRPAAPGTASPKPKAPKPATPDGAPPRSGGGAASPGSPGRTTPDGGLTGRVARTTKEPPAPAAIPNPEVGRIPKRRPFGSDPAPTQQLPAGRRALPDPNAPTVINPGRRTRQGDTVRDPGQTVRDPGQTIRDPGQPILVPPGRRTVPDETPTVIGTGRVRRVADEAARSSPAGGAAGRRALPSESAPTRIDRASPAPVAPAPPRRVVDPANPRRSAPFLDDAGAPRRGTVGSPAAPGRAGGPAVPGATPPTRRSGVFGGQPSPGAPPRPARGGFGDNPGPGPGAVPPRPRPGGTTDTVLSAPSGRRPATPNVQAAPAMPRPYSRWDPGNGNPPIELGRVVGAGRYATVYEIPGSRPPTVLKVFHQAEDTLSTPRQVLLETQKGYDLLRRANIETLDTKFFPDGAHPYALQRAVDPDKMRMLKVETTRRADFPPELQEAVVKLYKRLGKNDLIWEDGHLENLYFFRNRNGEVVAGILDSDRIARFSDYSGRLGDIRRGIQQDPHVPRHDIHSLRGFEDAARYEW